MPEKGRAAHFYFEASDSMEGTERRRLQMTREEARKRQKLVEKMTLEEKCSQLRYDAPAVKRLGYRRILVE